MVTPIASNGPEKLSLDRKDSHIAICLNEDIDFSPEQRNGFSAYRFEHDALPQLNFDDVSIETTFLGKKLSAPLIIGAMTGGTPRAGEINRRLAEAAERCGVAMALGSQRKMLENPKPSGVYDSFAVREFAPHLPLLFGNLGAVQLNYGVTAESIQGLIDRVGCDAFNFHLNPLQEVIQPEGNRNFSNLLEKLQAVVPQLSVPVFIKEVGAGISRKTAGKLKSIPCAGIETSGTGGTSWAKIESLRTANAVQRAVGEKFARWGASTAESLVVCRDVFPERLVVASGGVRSGIEMAKALALGADAVAVALPFLQAAEISVEAVVECITLMSEELRTVLFLTGFSNLKDFKAGARNVLLKESDSGYAILQ